MDYLGLRWLECRPARWFAPDLCKWTCWCTMCGVPPRLDAFFSCRNLTFLTCFLMLLYALCWVGLWKAAATSPGQTWNDGCESCEGWRQVMWAWGSADLWKTPQNFVVLWWFQHSNGWLWYPHNLVSQVFVNPWCVFLLTGWVVAHLVWGRWHGGNLHFPDLELLSHDVKSHGKGIGPFHNDLCFWYADFFATEHWNHWHHDRGFSSEHQWILQPHVHLLAGPGQLRLCLLCWLWHPGSLYCQRHALPTGCSMVGTELGSSLALEIKIETKLEASWINTMEHLVVRETAGTATTVVQASSIPCLILIVSHRCVGSC